MNDFSPLKPSNNNSKEMLQQTTQNMMTVMNVPTIVTIDNYHTNNSSRQQQDDDDDDNATFVDDCYRSPVTQRSLLWNEENDVDDDDTIINNNGDDEDDCESLCDWSDCSSVTMDSTPSCVQYFLKLKNYRKAAGTIADNYMNSTIRGTDSWHRDFHNTSKKNNKTDSPASTTAPRIPQRRGSISSTPVPLVPVEQQQRQGIFATQQEEEESSENEEVYSHPSREQLSVRRISDTTLITVDQHVSISRKGGSSDYCSAPPRLEQNEKMMISYYNKIKTTAFEVQSCSME